MGVYFYRGTSVRIDLRGWRGQGESSRVYWNFSDLEKTIPYCAFTGLRRDVSDSSGLGWGSCSWSYGQG